MLSLVLLTASFISIPFATIAQTESPSEKTNETKESAEKEVVLTIEGMINGGRFLFKGNTMTYGNGYRYAPPTDLLINGEPWTGYAASDPGSYMLDYTPDFSKMVILEKDWGPELNVFLIPNKESVALMVRPVESTLERFPVKVKLAMKNQVQHENLPPDENPWRDQSSRSNAAKSKVSDPASKEITLSLKGKIHRGDFVFEGNTIRFRCLQEHKVPEDITIDGKPWGDLSKPFILDYTPDFAKAGVLDKQGAVAVFVDVSKDRFVLRFVDPGRPHLDPVQVELAMKNQLPHDDIAFYQLVPAKVDPSQLMILPDGPDPLDVLWKECIREHKIILTGNMIGQSFFIFEGNTIRYRHGLYEYPYFVTVNGRRWGNLNEPFVLDFPIDTAHPEMVQTEGLKPIPLNRINSQRFELLFNDPRFDDVRSHYYSVTITPKSSKKQTTEQVPEQDNKALAESAGSLRGGIASRLPAK